MTRANRTRERQKNVAAILVIAVFAIIVFSVNAVGKYIAENLIAPLVSITQKAETNITQRVSVEPITFYAVSCGSFSSVQEADSACKVSREKGGGAFLWKNNETIFVLDSSYLFEESAKLRKTELENASILTLNCGGVTLRLTGTREQTETCKDSLTVFSSCVSDVLTASARMETGEISRLQMSNELQKAETKLKEQETALNALKSDHEVVRALREGYIALISALHDRPAPSDEKYLSVLRYMTGAIGYAYYEFCVKIA